MVYLFQLPLLAGHLHHRVNAFYSVDMVLDSSGVFTVIVYYFLVWVLPLGKIGVIHASGLTS